MKTTLSLCEKNHSLWQDYQTKKSTDRMLFPTEGANTLGVSEFELLLASPFSQYIGTDCRGVLEQLAQFGLVESIVRNRYAVHEKSGVYHNLKLGDKMGLAVNVGGLDLRFFLWQWQHMLAVSDTSQADKPSYSIQFFDGQGNAIDKVFLRALDESCTDGGSKVERWHALVEQHAQGVVADCVELEPLDKPKAWQYKALDDEGKQTLHDGWLAMTDVHQFHFLLKKLSLDRASSYHQAPENMAFPLQISAVEAMFEKVKERAFAIMIFVGNTGMVQIQAGSVKNLKRMGDWFNILDKAHNQFTLHLKDKALAQVWCIKRPTKDGLITSVEGFDKYGQSIFTVFGQRQEGQAELKEWQETTNELLADYLLQDDVLQSNIDG